jgi:beta-1,4-mannosyl-glycoprotein beta-1,4-N-acetylglucosaminyltransferase
MIVDYFLFFNEKELLELRINLLKDHVDRFIICEANKTFTGHPKQFHVKQLIKELNLPSEKIQVVELQIPDDPNLPIEEHDIISMFSEDIGDVISIKAMARDRIQRNGLLSILDQYHDDDWFIMSDCDEILNPAHLEFALHVAKGVPDKFVKLPLINLYGRADLRPYKKNGTPYIWRTSMCISQKSLIKQTTPHRIRCEIFTPFQFVQPTLNGAVFDEFGWHFSWMGGQHRNRIKSYSYAHGPNKQHRQDTKNGFVFEEGRSLVWDPQSTMVRYPHEKLPKLIFDLPRVKQFLLPDIGIDSKSTTTIIPNDTTTALQYPYTSHFGPLSRSR